ncbi:hypothetical protein ACGK9R_03345 [Halomonas sp. HNIBRBA4712]|uniref:hypothetical protein n=1 Tax=Halomonas sp. HNIBRBA4712 TaxID=3373087 RepID=UPI003744E439
MAKRISYVWVLGAVLGVAGAVPGGVIEARAQQNAPNTPSQALEVRETLTLDERLRDELTSAGTFNGKDGSRSYVYALALDENTLVELGVSGPLQGVVSLYNDQLEFLKSGESLRYHAAEAGDYFVVVSGRDASSYGPFTLTPRRMELGDADALTLEEPADFWLAGDEDTVALTIEQAGIYQLDMRSDEFDAYLVLEGPNGYQREDDDSGGDLNARITDFLEPGDYTLRPRTYGGGEGLYTLNARISEQADEFRNDGPLNLSERLEGWYQGTPLTYTLEIDEAGIYEINMVSSDIDAFLELHDDSGYYRENDDGGDGLDARLVDFLAPGSYQVIARSAYESGSSGPFSLSVEESSDLADGIELQNDGALTVGEPIHGWYSGEEVVYTLELEESSAVTIAMDSDHFDAYLELDGNGVQHADDDGGGGTNARLEASLLPGRYTVHARGYSASESGLFELTVESEPTEIEPDL